MTHSAFSWRRLLILTVLLVATAGAAAAPVRNLWLPLVARPLGLWTDGQVPAVSSQSLHAVSAPAGRVDVDGLITSVPERADFIAVPLAPEAVQQPAEADRTSYSATGSNSSAVRTNGNSGAVNSGRFDSSPRGLAPPASLNASPNGGGDARTSRTESQGNDDARSSTPSNSGGSFTSGRRDPGKSAKDDKRGSDDLFTEHRGGLGELTGKGHGNKGGSSGGPGGSNGHSHLASQPEPSTLLLLGTGLAVAAGAVRRRLRR